MYTQQDFDAMYVANSIDYNRSLRIQRIKDVFQIIGAIFTVAVAIHLLMKK